MELVPGPFAFRMAGGSVHGTNHTVFRRLIAALLRSIELLPPAPSSAIYTLSRFVIGAVPNQNAQSRAAEISSRDGRRHQPRPTRPTEHKTEIQARQPNKSQSTTEHPKSNMVLRRRVSIDVAPGLQSSKRIHTRRSRPDNPKNTMLRATIDSSFNNSDLLLACNIPDN